MIIAYRSGAARPACSDPTAVEDPVASLGATSESTNGTPQDRGGWPTSNLRCCSSGEGWWAEDGDAAVPLGGGDDACHVDRGRCRGRVVGGIAGLPVERLTATRGVQTQQ